MASGSTVQFNAASSISLLPGFRVDAGAVFGATIGMTCGTTQVQDYVSGIEYRNGALEAIYHGEGRVYYTGTTTSRYEYTLRDHLGNSRISFSDLNGNKVIDVPSEVLQENHYYPFGLAQEYGWMNNNAGDDSRYLYNGKESIADHGLNIYAYGFRYYDPAVARFVSVDPLADDFPYLSTFQYAGNTPLSAIDLDGLEPFFVVATPPITPITALSTAEVPIVRPAISLPRGISPRALENLLPQPSTSPIPPITGDFTLEGVEIIDKASSWLGKLARRVGGALESLFKKNSLNAEKSDIPEEGVYVFPDAQNPGKEYVGQSENIPKRLNQHRKSGKLDPKEENIETQEEKGGKLAREKLEQKKIDEKDGIKGGKVSNKRNPIGPKRQHLLDELID